MKTIQSRQNEAADLGANSIRQELDRAAVAEAPTFLRSLVRTLGGPAWRVHRYRDWHTRLLREAYCHADSPKPDRQSCLHG